VYANGARFAITHFLIPALFSLLIPVYCTAGDEVCLPTQSHLPFRVAYAHHFKESGVNVLSLRVSIGKHRGNSQAVLCKVGAAVEAKYRNEKRWQALIFSDHEVAEGYEAPSSMQKEPAAYMGGCKSNHDTSDAQVECGYW